MCMYTYMNTHTYAHTHTRTHAHTHTKKPVAKVCMTGLESVALALAQVSHRTTKRYILPCGALAVHTCVHVHVYTYMCTDTKKP